MTVSAPAKVNLGLSVTTRRGDGFHEIETIMARLDLADDLDVRLASSSIEGETHEPQDGSAPPWSVGLSVALAVAGSTWPTDTAAVPTDASNLVVRAATSYLRRLEAGRADGVHVHVDLTKRIPVAAGLGGGSSDAAAALVALSRLVPAQVDLPAVALSLGSDVPFFLTPWRAALARGRGERLSELDLPNLDLVLAKPPFGVSAAEAYSSLVGFTPRLRPAAIAAALAAGEEPGWRNALQPGVVRSYPAIRPVLAALNDAGLRGCIMSGSGPTCFGVAASRAHAEAVATQIGAAQPTWRVLAASLPRARRQFP